MRRQELLDALETAGDWQTVDEIAAKLHAKRSTVSSQISKLAYYGKLDRKRELRDGPTHQRRWFVSYRFPEGAPGHA